MRSSQSQDSHLMANFSSNCYLEKTFQCMLVNPLVIIPVN